MVTTSRCSVISFTVRVLGTLTSMPDCSTGAVIMKITSSTSTTSTSGVMLISASEDWVRPLLLEKATLDLMAGITARQFTARYFASLGGHPRRGRSPCRAHLNLFERIQQLPAEIVDGRGKDPHARRELVVGHNRGYRHEKAGRRGDQCFRDAGRHRAQRRGSRGSQSVKCIHYADLRSEQPRERAGRGNRGQPRQPAFECG